MYGLIRLMLVLCGLVLAVSTVSAKSPEDQGDITLPKPKKKKKKKPTYSVERGQLLYENHCQVCHSSVVHIREKRKATNVAAIRSWVVHWSSHLNLTWSNSEIDEVVHYLNTRHYHFKK